MKIRCFTYERCKNHPLITGVFPYGNGLNAVHLKGSNVTTTLGEIYEIDQLRKSNMVVDRYVYDGVEGGTSGCAYDFMAEEILP
jgi:hypothetical protein